MDTKVITINNYDWNDLVKICGKTCDGKSRPSLGYVYCEFVGDWCTAYAADGFRLSKLEFRCEKGIDLADVLILYLKPTRAPSGTKIVQLFVDQDKDQYDIVFVDGDEDVLESVTEPVPSFADPVDIPKIVKSCEENIDRYNHGQGQYCIAMNPKRLLAALEGFKSCDSVVLHFGGPYDAMMIRPRDDLQARAFVLPMRL